MKRTGRWFTKPLALLLMFAILMSTFNAITFAEETEKEVTEETTTQSEDQSSATTLPTEWEE